MSKKVLSRAAYNRAQLESAQEQCFNHLVNAAQTMKDFAKRIMEQAAIVEAGEGKEILDAYLVGVNHIDNIKLNISITVLVRNCGRLHAALEAIGEND
jgi:hypothetical protein